jgi:hypothetical protein
MLGMEHIFSQVPMARMTSPIEVRTSKLNRSLVRSKMIFSWMVEHDWYTKSWVRSYWHGIEMDNTVLSLDWPWRFTSAIRALGRMLEGTHETTMTGSMISKTQGVYLVVSGRYTSNSRDLEQMRRGLRSSMCGEVIALGPGYDLF